MSFPVPGKMECPSCGYSLLGLPAAHACPECGVEYDPHCVIIRLRGRSKAASSGINGLILLAFLAGYGLMEKDPTHPILPCAVPLGLITIVAMYRWAWHGGRDRLLIVSHAGIRLRHPDLSDEVVPWSRFGKARVNWVTGSLRIHGRDGKVLLKCKSSQLGSMRQAKYCVNQMNRLAEVYAAEGYSRTAESLLDGPAAS